MGLHAELVAQSRISLCKASKRQRGRCDNRTWPRRLADGYHVFSPQRAGQYCPARLELQIKMVGSRSVRRKLKKIAASQSPPGKLDPGPRGRVFPGSAASAIRPSPFFLLGAVMRAKQAHELPADKCRSIFSAGY